ncbi:MAG: GNAT family N-acetyltransferase [Anaerolineae bacterium]
MTTAEIISRPFGQNEDFEKVLAFICHIAQTSARPELNMHPGDVAWRFFRSNLFEPTEAIQIWEDVQTGEVAGLGWYTAAHHGVDLLVANPYRGTGLETRILTWAEQKLRQIPFEKRGYAEVKIQVFEWDKKRERVMDEAGYRRDMFHYIWFRYDLAQLGETPPLPDGFSIRPMTTEDTVERAELHNQAFFTEDVTGASYLKLMGSSVYQLEHDLVVVAPGGRLAAFALGWVDPILKTGMFEPVGVHPEFRRLGLAKSVLWAGMQQMQSAGMRLAQVYTESPNLHAQKLYRSAGFTVVSRQYDWVRK